MPFANAVVVLGQLDLVFYSTPKRTSKWRPPAPGNRHARTKGALMLGGAYSTGNASGLRSLDRCNEGRHEVVAIADDAEAGQGENRSIRIVVDGDDGF